MASSDLKRFMIPGALVVGGITAGSMLAPVALAAADDDSTDSTDVADSADADAETTDGDRRGHGRHGHLAHHPGAEVLTDTLGMTAAELRAAFADGKSVADIAEEQGVALEDLEAALVDAATERIDEALADERIDAERAAELKDELDDRIGEMLTRTPGERLGQGHGRHGDRRDRGGEVAEFLGLTTDELRAELAEGQTLAEVAAAQGVAEDDLVAFLVGQVEERLDQAVENGRIDADDVDDKLAEATERIEEHINTEPGERFDSLKDRLRWRHGHRHHHGEDRDAGDTRNGAPDTDGETVESSVDI